MPQQQRIEGPLSSPRILLLGLFFVHPHTRAHRSPSGSSSPSLWAMRSRAVSEEWCEEWSRLWCEAVVRRDGAKSGDGGGSGEAAEVFKTPWDAAIPLIAIGQPRDDHYHEMAHSAARFSAGVIDVLSVAEPPTLAAAVLVLSEADGAERRGSLGPKQFDRLLQRWDEDRDAGRPDAWQKFEGQAARVAALQVAAAQSHSSPQAGRQRCASPVAMRAMARARDVGSPPARMGAAAAQEIAAAPPPLSEREAERRRRRRRAQFARADLDKNGRLDLNELLFARQVGGAADCTDLSLDANPNPNPRIFTLTF